MLITDKPEAGQPRNRGTEFARREAGARKIIDFVEARKALEEVASEENPDRKRKVPPPLRLQPAPGDLVELFIMASLLLILVASLLFSVIHGRTGSEQISPDEPAKSHVVVASPTLARIIVKENDRCR